MDLLNNLFKGDKVIWIIFLCLCMISIVEVFSAASTLTYKTGDHWGPITQHTVILLVGVVIVWIFHKVNYRYFRTFSLFLVPGSIVLLFLVTLMTRVNGAARWMSIFGIQFQPSEFGKMAVIISVASILASNQDEDGSNNRAFKLIMLITAPICLLIAPENLSTAVMLFGVVFIMMFIGKIPFKTLAALGGGIMAVVLLVGCLAFFIPNISNLPKMHRLSTWKSRVVGFVAPKENVPAAKFDIDKDAQIAHANIAIATSNVVGKMPGNSVQRDFLSQAFSDFIFAIIIEELGLGGGIFVVALYIWLLIRVGRIAQKAKGSFATFLVMGIGLLLVSQAIVNMCVAVGLIPVTGQPLPLISKGGTSTIINCIYIGMVLSVSRHIEIQEKKGLDEVKEIEDTSINKEEIIAEENLI